MRQLNWVNRARVTTQNSKWNNTYNNNGHTRKFKGAAVHQKQHTPDEIYDAAKSSSTPIIHTISSEGGSVHKKNP